MLHFRPHHNYCLPARVVYRRTMERENTNQGDTGKNSRVNWDCYWSGDGSFCSGAAFRFVSTIHGQSVRRTHKGPFATDLPRMVKKTRLMWMHPSDGRTPEGLGVGEFFDKGIEDSLRAAPETGCARF